MTSFWNLRKARIDGRGGTLTVRSSLYIVPKFGEHDSEIVVGEPYCGSICTASSGNNISVQARNLTRR